MDITKMEVRGKRAKSDEIDTAPYHCDLFRLYLIPMFYVSLFTERLPR